MGEFKDARTPVLAEDHEKARSGRLRCPRNVRKSCDKTCSSSRDPDRWVGRCCSAARILMSRTHHNTDLDVVLDSQFRQKHRHSRCNGHTSSVVECSVRSGTGSGWSRCTHRQSVRRLHRCNHRRRRTSSQRRCNESRRRTGNVQSCTCRCSEARQKNPHSRCCRRTPRCP